MDLFVKSIDLFVIRARRVFSGTHLAIDHPVPTSCPSAGRRQRRRNGRGRPEARPLETIHPVIFFDALRVKISEDAVRNKAIYLALGCLPDSTRACVNTQRRASLGQRRSVQSKSHKSRGCDERGAIELAETMKPRVQTALRPVGGDLRVVQCKCQASCCSGSPFRRSPAAP